MALSLSCRLLAWSCTPRSPFRYPALSRYALLAWRNGLPEVAAIVAMALSQLQAACNELKIVPTTDAPTRSTAPTTSDEATTAAAAATTTITVLVPGSIEVSVTSLEEWPACSRSDRSDGTLARLQAACNGMEFVPTTEVAKVLASVFLPKLPCHPLHRLAPQICMGRSICVVMCRIGL